MIEVFGLERAPLAAGEIAEHGGSPTPVLDLPGDEAIDQPETLRLLGGEIAWDARDVFRRRRSTVRSRHAK